MDSIKNLIESPHPYWKAYQEYWQFLLNSYEGGVDYTKAHISNQSAPSFSAFGMDVYVGGKKLNTKANSNLFKHQREKDEDYQERIRQSYYYNHVAPILDIYTEHLFKKPVIEDFGSIQKTVDQRREDIDRQGSSIIEWRKEVADLTQLFGHLFVVTDRPQGQGERTKADQIKTKNFPYFTTFYPTDALNWACDGFGNLYWIVFREVADANADHTNYNKDQRATITYRLWTRTEWFLYDCQYVLIDSGIHGLGEVPVTVTYDKRSKTKRGLFGISYVSDIAFIARDVYNACSNLSQILRDQTFSMLTVQGTSDEYKADSAGVHKGLLYPVDRNAPAYLSPLPENARVIMEYIEQQISKIYQIAKLEDRSASSKGQQVVEQSGVSKAWDFHSTNSALSRKASNLEDGERRAWGKFSKWEGKPEFDGKVEYPHDFNVQSINEDVAEAEGLAKLSLGKVFMNEVRAEIIKKKYPRAQEEDIKKMIAGMEEKAETEEPQQGFGKLKDKLNIFKTSNKTE